VITGEQFLNHWAFAHGQVPSASSLRPCRVLTRWPRFSENRSATPWSSPRVRAPPDLPRQCRQLSVLLAFECVCRHTPIRAGAAFHNMAAVSEPRCHRLSARRLWATPLDAVGRYPPREDRQTKEHRYKYTQKKKNPCRPRRRSQGTRIAAEITRCGGATIRSRGLSGVKKATATMASEMSFSQIHFRSLHDRTPPPCGVRSTCPPNGRGKRLQGGDCDPVRLPPDNGGHHSGFPPIRSSATPAAPRSKKIRRECVRLLRSETICARSSRGKPGLVQTR